MKRALVLLCCALAACAPQPKPFPEAQYWQRVDASDAVYTRGPKAQEMLSRDIARCVTELREMERMGMARDAIPADPTTGRVLDPDDPRLPLRDYEAPARAGFLRTELGQYHDFEGCMDYAGWQRVEFLPYETVHRAQGDHIDALWDTRHPRPEPEPWAPAPPSGGYTTPVNE